MTSLPSLSSIVLPHLLPLEISGPDAERYLQARLTQDIKRLPVGRGLRSLVLNAQGRVEGVCFVLRRESSFLLLGEIPLKHSSTSEERQLALSAFLKPLLRFKVSDQFTVFEQNSWQVRYLFSETSNAEMQLAGLLPAEELAFAQAGNVEKTLLAFKYSLHGISGFFAIAADQHLDELTSNTARLGLSAWEVLRICHGLPQFDSELNEKMLATEVEVSSLISFAKGCYTGQEVVEMSTARGRPNRYLLHFIAPTNAALTPGSDIRSESGICGVLTSCCFSSAFFAESLRRAFGKPDLAGKEFAVGLGFVKSSIPRDAALFLGDSDIPLQRLSPTI